ncbi:GNAT family N-acetyltransferase [Chryseobacterium sp. BIGb0232]|uniref:GNAT family N-acetyltransferase n=1 Tax=Chryseobacterium sp. BIGb0232 TaxID=2940598 RepID=UPI000FB4E45B|nr:GNAT family N-acetyltransferase [Chryseobacterium sp. BIGb0232]MCS4300982.1 putative GNAT family N-acyltransferase [Chryseobacterium sp. BIGb0232]ROS20152.1 putative GNAT family N-acyltransferase [Chryseobacterium nakagawai]
MEIIITKITENDIAELQEISKKTFSETFSADNTEESMAQYLETSFATEKLHAELNDRNSEFYFARLDHKVIGYLKLNSGSSQTEMKGDHALEIERIYVSKDFHGKKVGQALYDKAMAIATEKNADYLWLGVWENNLRAINFYRKNGFKEFDKHIFRLGNEEQTDIMMKLDLKSNTMKTEFFIKSFEELSTLELYNILKLRSEIFIIEQNCVYQDIDDKDLKCHHLMCLVDGNLAGYTRIVPHGLTYEDASIGRVVIGSDYRGLGLGKQLMENSIKGCQDILKESKIRISAQLYLLKFYNALGFKEVGSSYDEDGIPHIEMVLN